MIEMCSAATVSGFSAGRMDDMEVVELRRDPRFYASNGLSVEADARRVSRLQAGQASLDAERFECSVWGVCPECGLKVRQRPNGAPETHALCELLGGDEARRVFQARGAA